MGNVFDHYIRIRFISSLLDDQVTIKEIQLERMIVKITLSGRPIAYTILHIIIIDNYFYKISFG